MASVILSAEDLFFMAKYMNAKYLDYEYVTMLGDISKKFSMKEAQALDRLDQAGLIFEDFSGDMEIEDKAKLLLEPIFFGQFESELIIEDHQNLKKYKFHVLDGKYVQVKIEDKMLEIKNIQKEDILTCCPYVEENAEKMIHDSHYFLNKEVTGIMVLKRTKIEKESECIQLINDEGVFYMSNQDKIESLNKNELKALMKNKLWEE